MVKGLIFLYSIAEVVSHKINSGENLIVKGSGGGTFNFFGVVFGKNHGGQYMIGEHIFF